MNSKFYYYKVLDHQKPFQIIKELGKVSQYIIDRIGNLGFSFWKD